MLYLQKHPLLKFMILFLSILLWKPAPAFSGGTVSLDQLFSIFSSSSKEENVPCLEDPEINTQITCDLEERSKADLAAPMTREKLSALVAQEIRNKDFCGAARSLYWLKNRQVIFPVPDPRLKVADWYQEAFVKQVEVLADGGYYRQAFEQMLAYFDEFSDEDSNKGRFEQVKKSIFSKRLAEARVSYQSEKYCEAAQIIGKNDLDLGIKRVHDEDDYFKARMLQIDALEKGRHQNDMRTAMRTFMAQFPGHEKRVEFLDKIAQSYYSQIPENVQTSDKAACDLPNPRDCAQWGDARLTQIAYRELLEAHPAELEKRLRNNTAPARGVQYYTWDDVYAYRRIKPNWESEANRKAQFAYDWQAARMLEYGKYRFYGEEYRAAVIVLKQMLPPTAQDCRLTSSGIEDVNKEIENLKQRIEAEREEEKQKVLLKQIISQGLKLGEAKQAHLKCTGRDHYAASKYIPEALSYLALSYQFLDDKVSLEVVRSNMIKHFPSSEWTQKLKQNLEKTKWDHFTKRQFTEPFSAAKKVVGDKLLPGSSKSDEENSD